MGIWYWFLVCQLKKRNNAQGFMPSERWNPLAKNNSYGEVSLHGWCWMRQRFTSLVESKPAKQEVSHTYSDTSPYEVNECSLLLAIIIKLHSKLFVLPHENNFFFHCFNPSPLKVPCIWREIFSVVARIEPKISPMLMPLKHVRKNNVWSAKYFAAFSP